MQNNIKIIFVDIDWTILDHKVHEFDMPSIEALKKAQKNGIQVYLCTARPYLSVKQTGLLNLLKPNGIVCTNGAVAFINDKLLYSLNIPNDVVRETIKVCNRHNAVLEYCDEKMRYFNRKTNKYVDNYFSVYAEVVPEVKKYNNENVSAMLLMAPRKYDEKMKKELPKGLDYFRFDDFGVDIKWHEHDPNKGYGVINVLKELKINKENAMAIGDDYGDLDMFKEVGLSVSLENGKPEVKAKADYVTKAVDQSGVAYALKHFNIIK